MLFDYNKLRGRIVEKYGSQRAFAAALGVSERTLSLKLNNKIFFAQDEINNAVSLLEIDIHNVKEYFFVELVQ